MAGLTILVGALTLIAALTVNYNTYVVIIRRRIISLVGQQQRKAKMGEDFYLFLYMYHNTNSSAPDRVLDQPSHLPPPTFPFPKYIKKKKKRK